jgi:DNA-binding transcriptional ArsR family regulator
MNSVESVFEVIAEPNRRAILSLLVESQQSVGEIERQLRSTSVYYVIRALSSLRWMLSGVSIGCDRNHCRNWMPGLLPSAGFGPPTWTLSSAISTASIPHPHRQREKFRKRRGANRESHRGINEN